MQEERQIYLSLGSNLGDRSANLSMALDRISTQAVRITGASAIYESEAWGFASDHSFYNCCISLTTGLEPLLLLDLVLKIEVFMGRIRKGKGYRDRNIDIDILFYGQEIFRNERLKIPHPGIAIRKFVLVPLNEIAPGFRHPETGLTITGLLKRCPDPSWIRKLENLRIR